MLRFPGSKKKVVRQGRSQPCTRAQCPYCDLVVFVRCCCSRKLRRRQFTPYPPPEPPPRALACVDEHGEVCPVSHEVRVAHVVLHEPASDDDHPGAGGPNGDVVNLLHVS